MKFLFDLDGTVTQQETLPIIARHFGAEGDMAQLTEQAVRGAVPYEQSLRSRVNMLIDISVTEIASIMMSMPLNELVVAFIQAHPTLCAVVTSNLDCWCSPLIKRLGCPGFCTHAITRQDKVTSIANIIKKEQIVDRYKALGETVVFIGDGHNDLEAMRHANIAIAVGFSQPSAPSLNTIADYVVKEQKTLYDLLNYFTFSSM